MASSSGSQVGLCAENFGERILSETNDVCHEGIRIRFLIWRDQHVGCVAYDSIIHTTHA